MNKSMVILMADDDPDDRLLAQDALTECHLQSEIQFVENGEELLDYLRRRGKYAQPQEGRTDAASGPVSAPRPSLILLDLNMPRKDGREALREIKTDPDLRRIPVIVLTTSKADTDISKIYELGANSFISKPVTFDSLVNVMKIVVNYWLEIVELPFKR